MNSSSPSLVTADYATLELLHGLKGKTISAVRPSHHHGPVPEVTVIFTDHSSIMITVPDGVYFESCFINSLRKSKPVVDVRFKSDGAGTHTITLWSRTFPLLQLSAVNKARPPEEFPFDIAPMFIDNNR